MKKLIALFMGLVLVFSLTACGSTSPSDSSQAKSSVEEQDTSAAETSAAEAAESDVSESEMPSDLEAEPESGKTLVVYYSATGNTEEAANYIAAATNADVFELEPKDPYTDADLDWTDDNSRVVYEHDNPDARDIELVAATVPDWESYDTVFIGYPIWWYTMAPAVLSFLKSYDWTGKMVIPFQTHGGWPGHVIKDIKNACKGADFSHEMEIQFDSTGGAELVTLDKKVETWIDQIKK